VGKIPDVTKAELNHMTVFTSKIIGIDANAGVNATPVPILKGRAKSQEEPFADCIHHLHKHFGSVGPSETVF
jgi:hypothetical protein